TTGNVTVRGMLIPDEFSTNDIRATKEYKEYEKMFFGVDVPTIQPQPVESTQGKIRTPSAHRTPTSTTIIDKRDEESYASEFNDLAFQNDDDDSGNKIEPESHKEHPKVLDDDDENEKEKKDDDNDDDVDDDHTDHTLDKTQKMGSLETSNEKMQTPISSPHRPLG
nr:hypothetical protein [Tanacetum cinerariifolium]